MGNVTKKEKSIQNYMKCLSISREEAEQLWADDNNDFIGEGEELQARANALPKKYESTEKAKKKRTVKKDEEKMRIVSILNQALIDNGFSTTVSNVQRAIDFGDYTLTLIKHRPPKK
jgi:hypothetical protein